MNSERFEIVKFDELSMKEAKNAAKANKVVILPIGSVEEHGDHLPLCTDSLQQEHVAYNVAMKTESLVAPPIRYGVCNLTRNFPGTISTSFQSLHRFVRDILKEFVRNGFTKILVLSGHAGDSHMAALRLAAQDALKCYEENSSKIRLRIMVCSDYDFAYELKGKHFSEKDGHAGTIETSRVMAFRPDLVKIKRKKGFPKFPRFEMVANPETYFPTGIIGDSTEASVDQGHMINKYVEENVTKLVERLKQ